MDMDQVLKWGKELGVPLMGLLACLYFYTAKIVPAQHERDKEKDSNFIKSLNDMSNRTEAQTKLFIESQRSMLDTFKSEAEENRKQDADVREHHKQVIETISKQTKDSLEQNNRWLDASQINHKEIREDLKEIKVTLDSKFDLMMAKLK